MDRPSLLRFTWSHSGWADPSASSIVTVEFAPHDEKQTLMSIEHELLPTQDALEDHQHGWEVTADQLAGRLARR